MDAIRRKLRRNRLRRGAAMTEGVIISGLFMVLFALLWGAVVTQRTKLRVMDEARSQAWATALKGGDKCGEERAFGRDDLNQGASAAGESGVPQDGETDKYAKVFGGGGHDLGRKDAGYVSVVITKNASVPKFIGGKTYSMQGKFHVRCNEPLPKEGLGYFFKQAWGIVSSIIGSFL
jgi:hypothetical protein